MAATGPRRNRSFVRPVERNLVRPVAPATFAAASTVETWSDSDVTWSDANYTWNGEAV